MHDIGQVKVGRFGMGPEDWAAGIPEQFDRLDERFFSLGQDDTYYLALRELGDEVRRAVLAELRDVALDPDLHDRARTEQVFTTSLARSVSPQTVTGQYRRIARGGPRMTEYLFDYQAPPGGGAPGASLRFEVHPDSHPPTNIHALIGSNGVGKTRMLGQIARAVADAAATASQVGTVTDLNSSVPVRVGRHDGRPLFANLVSVCFSVFDPFMVITEPNGTVHTHVSVNQPPDAQTGQAAPRTREALAEDFLATVESLTGARLTRWQAALATLETDPLFEDARMSAAADPPVAASDALGQFRRLSSGHQIVLLAITHLADKVAEQSLVLIDEPETHLHPPLLSAFIRAVSDLLIDRNGVAIIATHSPVVLQETPRTCAWKLYRSGGVLTVDRPEIETFGENVGVLTREAFGLEVTRSGFHREIEEAVSEGLGYEGVLDRFGGQLGGEARAIARALIATRDLGWHR